MSGRIWGSMAGNGHAVPFFLMPTLGGADYLQAFNVYRFRDLDAAWVKTEYRHAVHEMVDLVGFYEFGTVARAPRDLSFAQAISSVGLGVSAHTKTASIARLAVARGRDGFHLTIVFSPGGA